ncbi:MAG: YabP/YqfC family sporulation protein, partial [Clostridia bacterium]|nr:YabP/YqfC family sporulation protein [Clostridia bacterium]
LEYQDDIVRINTGTFILLVKGRRLYIKCMTATSITLCGYISGVEFLK